MGGPGGRGGRAGSKDAVRPAKSSRKSDLRNHRTIVRPRSYDGAMVTQITLNTDPTGSILASDTLTEKLPKLLALDVVPGRERNVLTSPDSRAAAFAHWLIFSK